MKQRIWGLGPLLISLSLGAAATPVTLTPAAEARVQTPFAALVPQPKAATFPTGTLSLGGLGVRVVGTAPELGWAARDLRAEWKTRLGLTLGDAAAGAKGIVIGTLADADLAARTKAAGLTPSGPEAYALWVDDGTLNYEYNLFELERTRIASTAPLPRGKTRIEVETRKAGTGHAAPLDVAVRVNGNVVAQGRVPRSAPLTFTANDAFDVGRDSYSPVSLAYFDRKPFKYNGAIDKVRIQYVK